MLTPRSGPPEEGDSSPPPNPDPNPVPYPPNLPGDPGVRGKGLYSDSRQFEVEAGMLRMSSVTVTETPLAAMGERVLRGGVWRAVGLLEIEGEEGALGRSNPLPPQGLAKS